MEDEAVTETSAFDDATGAEPAEGAQVDQKQRKLVERLCKRIKADKKHHEKAYKRMKRDMRIARRGADKDWPEDWYVANITGRHIRQSVAALYAKNPKAIARRAERLEFTVWDETEQSLLQAFNVLQQAQAAAMADPMGGQMLMADPQVQQAMAVAQDFVQGQQRRDMLMRIGKTLEVLYDYYMREQKPVDFKTSMKQFVRRAKTVGCAFVEIGFQREYEQNYDVTAKIADHRRQIDHIRSMAQKMQEPDQTNDEEANTAELEQSLRSLQEQEYVLIREGLVFDFPESTRVIPDRATRALTGFVGSRWLTIEYLYTPDEVRELFGVDLKRKFTPYSIDGVKSDQAELDFDGDNDPDDEERALVWKHYDRATGSCYYICEGHPDFLKPPAPPDVYVEDFWPVYALTFNEVEDPDEIFPPSDVSLMYDMQKDYNTARQGQREHRQAARPRWATPKGSLSDEDKQGFAQSNAFDVVEFNPGGAEPDIRRILQQVPISGVDPNLYEVGTIFTDVQLTVGAHEAEFGAVGKATATGSAIAEGGRVASVADNVDDLDNLLNALARASGQILLREMTPDKVREIAGPGAVWPQMTLDEIAAEVYLETEAGSSGKPNQAQEIANWERMLPFLIQMPSISPEWLAKESLRRLDDRMDLTDALAANMPAIVAQNRMAQPAPADPGAAPDQQGGEGGDNGARGQEGTAGSNAPMGNNQV